MTDFVELWVYLASTPLFGLTATLVVYVLAHAAYERLQQAPWANPVLWTVLTLAVVLLATGVSYPSYFAGAQWFSVGAARALQVNSEAGAYAGLALGLQVVLASLLMPLVFRLF